MSSRREFLRVSSLILASYGISPLIRQNILQKLSVLALSEASAQSTSASIDFYLDFSVRNAICLGEFFPSRGFSDPSANYFRGLTMRDNVIFKDVSGGRRLFLTQAAYNNGGESLEQFADNIAVMENIRELIVNHSNTIWPHKIGGFQPVHQGGIPLGAPASHVPLFAQMRGVSGAQAPSIPGVLRTSAGNEESYADCPTLTPYNGIQTIRSLFPVIQPKIGATEAGEILKAVKEINRVQTEMRMKLRFSNAEDAKLAAEQGIEVLSNPPVDTLSYDYNAAVRADWGADETSNLGHPLGEDLLVAYIGFKRNIIGSMAIHMTLNHPHFINDFDNRTTVIDEGARYTVAAMKEQYKYFGRKLGKFLKALSTTAHPFRAGKTLFDHTLITISSEGGRGLDIKENPDLGWVDTERQSICIIGGNVRGGYYGDVMYTSTGSRAILAFDPNSGNTTGDGRMEPHAVYKTVAELLGIPPSRYQSRMGSYYNVSSLAALKR